MDWLNFLGILFHWRHAHDLFMYFILSVQTTNSSIQVCRHWCQFRQNFSFHTVVFILSFVFPLCHSNGLLVCTPLFLFYSTNYLFIHKLRERIKFETFQCFNGVVLSSVMFLILYQIRILCIQLGRILLRFHYLHVVYEHEPPLNKVWQYHLVRMNSKKIPIELKPKNFRK